MKQKTFLLTILALLVLFSIGYRHYNHAWICEQLYLEQAKSFLEGRLDIDVSDLDTAIWKGQYYAPYPPTPALIFAPAVFAFGTQPLIPYFVCLIATLLIGLYAFRICRHLKLSVEISLWLSTGLILGTGLWMSVQYSYSATYNSHIIACLFVIAGLYEAMVKKRAWLIGLLLSAAFTTRPFTITSGLFMLALLWASQTTTLRQKGRDFILFTIGAMPLLLFSFAFNYFRFGHIFDAGYSHIPGFNFTSGSLFDFRFIPRNLYTIFLRGPNMDALFDAKNVSSAIEFKHGIIGSDMGTALTFASPFLLYAFFAPLKNRAVKIGWIAAALNLAPILCYAAIGMFQLNCARYALDMLPIIFVLTAMGITHHNAAVKPLQFLIGYSVLLNILFLTPLLAFFIRHYILFLLAIGA